MTADMQGIAVAKGTAMAVLGGVAFLITVFPVFLNRWLTSHSAVKKNSPLTDHALSLFLSFGGGVLLCTTFLHLLPEVAENIEHLQNTGEISEEFPLPLPELVMCLGFFTMYIIEWIVHKFLVLFDKNDTIHESDNTSPDILESDKTVTEVYKEILHQDKIQVAFSPPHKEDISIFPKNARKNYGTSCSVEVNHNHHDHFDHDHQHHNVTNHTLEHHKLDTDEPHSYRELMMVLALSVHEAFEGLAIGLESSIGAVWYMLIAVAVHKCVIAFCIGVDLVYCRTSIPKAIFCALIYSCASPLGIAVGLLISTTGKDVTTLLLSVILQGLATGTLLYVVFFEVLCPKDHRRVGFSQVACVLAGFFTMAILMVITDA